MAINYDDLISRRIDDMPFTYNDVQILLYNLSVGMGRDPLDEKELPFIFERPALCSVPSAATVLGMGGMNILETTGIDLRHVLHGEQRLTLLRQLPPAAELVTSTFISEVTDKGSGKGAIVTIKTDARLKGGDPLYVAESVVFARADGGFGGPSKSHASRQSVPERAPDIVQISSTRPEQALLYRLTGDRNPLHAEPGYAAEAGFSAPILHGLCTYGIACRAILASVCGYASWKINQFDARFTSPVFPGETVQTDIWVDGATIAFRCHVKERAVVALDNGRCVIAI